jgi:hypothetical protein
MHPGQLKAWDSIARFVFIIAGTQSGKTSWGPWWLAREIQRCGPGDYLAATASYDLFKLKMLPEMKYAFCTLMGWQWMASDRIIQSPDEKTRIILRSASAEGGLESATAKAAWIDECGQDDFRLQSWEATQRRLSLSQGRVLGTTTPYNLGWLKTEVFDRWRNGDHDFQIVQFRSTMNPIFPQAEYDRAKATMAPWKFAMYYDGEFSRPAGMIYSDFDDDLNTCSDFPIPAEWPRYVGHDFGPVHTATVWVALDPVKNVYYLYRETLEGDKTTKQHVETAKLNAKGENVVLRMGGAPSEDQYRMDWGEAGWPIQRPYVADVEAGIDRVIALIKPRRLFRVQKLQGHVRRDWHIQPRAGRLWTTNREDQRQRDIPLTRRLALCYDRPILRYPDICVNYG